MSGRKWLRTWLICRKTKLSVTGDSERMLSGSEILPCIWASIIYYGFMHASRKHETLGSDKGLKQLQHNKQQKHRLCVSSPNPKQVTWRGLGEYCAHWVCFWAKEPWDWGIHLFYANLLFALEGDKTFPLKIAPHRHSPEWWSGQRVVRA